MSVCNIACIVVFHTRVGVAHAGLGGAGPHGGRVDGAVAEVRAVAGLAAAAGVVWAVCAKAARMLCSHLFLKLEYNSHKRTFSFTNIRFEHGFDTV